MQTPEGLMRTIIGYCEEVADQHGDLWCRTRIKELVDGICPKADATLDLIRARDAEVRADERAKVLAGFTAELVERRDCGCRMPPGQIGSCCFRCGDVIAHECRLVGPWEPAP